MATEVHAHVIARVSTTPNARPKHLSLLPLLLLLLLLLFLLLRLHGSCCELAITGIVVLV